MTKAELGEFLLHNGRLWVPENCGSSAWMRKLQSFDEGCYSDRVNRVRFETLDWSEDSLTCLLGGRPFTGVAYEEDDVGHLIGEVSFVNGLREGLMRAWYASGVLKTEGMYYKGSIHGPIRTWFENGCLKRAAEYELAILKFEEIRNDNGEVISRYVLTPENPQYETLELLRRGHKKCK